MERNGTGDKNDDDKDTNTTETFGKWFLAIRRMNANGTMDHEMSLKLLYPLQGILMPSLALP